MSSPSARITILTYHQVGHFGRVRKHRTGFCDCNAFRRQMAFLRAGGYKVLSLRELVTGLEGRASIPPRAVHLTFDGGTADFATNAWPVLQRFEYPASVLLVSDHIGKNADWLGRAGLDVVPTLDATSILRLQKEGVRFGSHTRTHGHLIELDTARLDDEVTGSRDALRETLGRDVFAFCYPYGEVNRSVLRAVGNAGYRLGFTCERNRASRGTHPLLLPRHAISYGTSLLGLYWKLKFQRPGKPLDVT